MIDVFWDVWVGLCIMWLVVPSRPRVAQNAPSVLPKANLRSDGGGRRVSICRLAHAFRLSFNRSTIGVFVVTSGSLVQRNIVSLSFCVIDYLSCGQATYGFPTFSSKSKAKPSPFGTGVGWTVREQSSLALRPRTFWVNKFIWSSSISEDNRIYRL